MGEGGQASGRIQSIEKIGSQLDMAKAVSWEQREVEKNEEQLIIAG